MILCKEEVKQLNMRSREMSASLLEQIHVQWFHPFQEKVDCCVYLTVTSYYQIERWAMVKCVDPNHPSSR